MWMMAMALLPMPNSAKLDALAVQKLVLRDLGRMKLYVLALVSCACSLDQRGLDLNMAAASINVFATGEDYKVYRCSIH
jgi:hypothetical protein